jgi:hypothetical protein
VIIDVSPDASGVIATRDGTGESATSTMEWLDESMSTTEAGVVIVSISGIAKTIRLITCVNDEQVSGCGLLQDRTDTLSPTAL